MRRPTESPILTDFPLINNCCVNSVASMKCVVFFYRISWIIFVYCMESKFDSLFLRNGVKNKTEMDVNVKNIFIYINYA